MTANVSPSVDPAQALYTTAQVRALDAHAVDKLGVPGPSLMQRAAEAAFGVLRQRWPGARHIVVTCGPGNNGGDGFLLAGLARDAGCVVTVLALTEQSRGDAALARAAWVQSGGEIEQTCSTDVLAAADLIVDALFGSGLTRPLAGEAADWVDAIVASGKPVLALDVPSGLDADTGKAAGSVVHAEATASFVGWKRGLFTGQAADCCGALSLHTLDLPDEVHATQRPDARLLINVRMPPRARASHKGDHGHVLVVGGDLGTGGAALLAGKAALRGGAGLVSVATRAEHVPAILARRPELMARAVASPRQLQALLERASVWLVGPGLGHEDWGHGLWRDAVAGKQPLVLDADGLNLLASSPWDFAGRETVLTPHPGEAARLLGTDAASVQADRFAAARTLARHFHSVVVLKGAGSLVADEQGRVAVCRHGNPGLASGGTGDVLGGLIAALMAQGLSSWQAACLGTDVHARAGDMAARQGERGLLASDLFAPVRALLNSLDA